MPGDFLPDFLILDHGWHVRPHGNIVRGVRVRRKNIAQFGVHRDAVTRQIGQSAPDRRRSGVGQYADLDTVFLQQRLHLQKHLTIHLRQQKQVRLLAEHLLLSLLPAQQ
mgnify:CR=1 FL=1